MAFSYLPLVSVKERVADPSYASPNDALSPEPVPPGGYRCLLCPTGTASAETFLALSSPDVPRRPCLTLFCACLCLHWGQVQGAAGSLAIGIELD